MWYLSFRVWLISFTMRISIFQHKISFFWGLLKILCVCVLASFCECRCPQRPGSLSCWSPSHLEVLYLRFLLTVPSSRSYNKFFHFDSIYFLLCVSVLPVCGICTTVMLWSMEVRNGPGYPGTGLQMAVSLQVCARNQSRVLCKSNKGF